MVSILLKSVSNFILLLRNHVDSQKGQNLPVKQQIEAFLTCVYPALTLYPPIINSLSNYLTWDIILSLEPEFSRSGIKNFENLCKLVRNNTSLQRQTQSGKFHPPSTSDTVPDPLQNLFEIFPDVPPARLQKIWVYLDKNEERVIDKLLENPNYEPSSNSLKIDSSTKNPSSDLAEITKALVISQQEADESTIRSISSKFHLSSQTMKLIIDFLQDLPEEKFNGINLDSASITSFLTSLTRQSCVNPNEIDRVSLLLPDEYFLKHVLKLSDVPDALKAPRQNKNTKVCSSASSKPAQRRNKSK